jgi:hypothetical protein
VVDDDRTDRPAAGPPAYEPPALTSLGSVAELTELVGPSVSDN